MAEVIVTLFQRRIQKQLFPKNAFYKNSTLDYSGVDIDAQTVKIPEESSNPNVQKNPSSFPLPISEMDDDGSEYNVEHYATEPTRIKDVTEAIVSYDKQTSVLSRHTSHINTMVADDFAIKFTPSLAAQIVETSGDLGASLAPSATGNRRKTAKKDWIKVFEMFNKADIPDEGRLALIPAEMYSEILEIDGFVDADKIGRANLVDGAIGRLLNFDIMMRSRTAIYTAANAPASLGAAGAIGDKLSTLFWHPEFVRRSEGMNKVYASLNRPEHLGNIFNIAVRAGGRKSYLNERGTVALVQASS